MSEPSDSNPADRDPGSRSFVAELEFFSPDLEDATPERVPLERVPLERVDGRSVVEGTLLPALRQFRLVLFGGPRLAEKPLFARHLAWYAQRTHPCEVQQWRHDPSLVQIEDALTRFPPHTLFLFPGLQPHQLGGYELNRLVEHLRQRSQSVIVTTDSGWEQWNLTPAGSEKGIWCSAAELRFDPVGLAELLLIHLEEQERPHPELAARIEELTPASELVPGFTVQKLTAELGTPSRVHAFLQALDPASELTPEVVRKARDQILDPGRGATWWFRGLGPREQMLVLGLSLLDGLLDDQFFSALEILVQETWRRWDPNLTNYDYHELPPLAAYFEGTREQTATASLRCTLEDCRQALLDLGWKLHRRRLVASLPVLAELVRAARDDGDVFFASASAPGGEPGDRDGGGGGEREDGDHDPNRAAAPGGEDGPADEDGPGDSQDAWWASRWDRPGQRRDLFGSPQRSRLVRQSVAGTLSRVGRISLNAVEPSLIELASDKRTGVQLVAAAALALWRELDPGGAGDRRLFQILDQWQDDAFLQGFGHLLHRGRGASRPFAHVRATVALTVGRAALYDPPNHLHQELVRLFARLIGDPDPIVRMRVHDETVPVLVTAHLRQLQELLWKQAVPQGRLTVPIARGIAVAHRLRPGEAAEVLETWHRKAHALAPGDPDGETRRRRRHALRIVAHACGMLDPDDVEGNGRGWSEESIFRVLRELLAREDDPEVRKAVLIATFAQAERKPERLLAGIRELVGELSRDERQEMEVRLTRIYLQQRSRLHKLAGEGAPPPDRFEVIGKVRFPLWLHAERPLTPVETMLNALLDDPSYEASVQLAVACVARFEGTAVDREELRLQESVEETEAEEPQAEEEPFARVDRGRVRKLSPAGLLAVFVVVPWDRQRRAIVATALPEYLAWSRRGKGPWAQVLSAVWNRGRPRWELLKRWGTYAPLVRLRDTEEHPLQRRLVRVAGSRGRQLARQLSRAERVVRWRWGLGVAVLIFLAVLWLVVG